MASAVNKVGYVFLTNRSCDGRMTSFLCEQSERVIFNGECWWSSGTLYIIPKLVIWASRALSAPSCQWAAPLLILFTSIRDEKNKMPLAAVCLWFPTTQCQLPLVPSSVACRLSLATLRLTSNPEKVYASPRPRAVDHLALLTSLANVPLALEYSFWSYSSFTIPQLQAFNAT